MGKGLGGWGREGWFYVENLAQKTATDPGWYINSKNMLCLTRLHKFHILPGRWKDRIHPSKHWKQGVTWGYTAGNSGANLRLKTILSSPCNWQEKRSQSTGFFIFIINALLFPFAFDHISTNRAAKQGLLENLPFCVWALFKGRLGENKKLKLSPCP